MNIDAIHLSPIKRAEHIKHNKYFICHKIRCHIKNHPQGQSHNQGPPYPPRNSAQVKVITTLLVTPPTLKPKSELAQFVGSLEKNRTTKEKILQVLATRFTEEDEEKVEMIATTKIEEVEDF